MFLSLKSFARDSQGGQSGKPLLRANKQWFRSSGEQQSHLESLFKMHIPESTPSPSESVRPPWEAKDLGIMMQGP